jgi:tRNA nucleotidyltransferase/poly(A) polymerase
MKSADDPERRVTFDFAELQGGTIEEDLARRDFTINAMAISLNRVNEVIDPFKGQNDLRKRIVRALCRQTFQDDPLRLLRAYRMAAQFDMTIEPRTSRWIASESDRFAWGERTSVARERLREELLRLLNQAHSAAAVEGMDKNGLLTVIFPELEAGRRVGLAYYGKGGVLKHHLDSVANLEWLMARLNEGEIDIY